MIKLIVLLVEFLPKIIGIGERLMMAVQMPKIYWGRFELDDLNLVISSSYAKSYLSGQSIGMTMNNLNQDILQNMPVPIPPFAEQKRIIVTQKSALKMLEE